MDDLAEETQHDQIDVEHLNGITVVHLRGQFLGGEETERLRSTLRTAPQESRVVVLDLSGVSFVNSSFLSSLLSEHTSHRRLGKEIRLAGLQPTVKKILELTHLTSVIPVFATVSHAQS